MAQTITVTLAPDVEKSLADFTREEGLRADEVIGEAVKEYLFLRRFRSLRERLAAKARSQGIVTDQDVFDRVS